MMFQPAPANDFAEFIHVYFERCRSACPKLRAIAGKWRFEDLIPGLSDFDSRFIASNDTGADDWAEMSLAVGRVHTDLALAEPRWARILEHLPGLNLTVAELTDPRLYYPEFRQWTFYEGDEPVLEQVRSRLDAGSWTRRDELFHLKKIAAYIGPYQRGIDPPVNIGLWENKYPLHSRFMHYFCPPVQAAVSLAQKQTVRGNREALMLARRIFPRPRTIDRILHALERHYEIPEWYADAALAAIENELAQYLQEAWNQLTGHITLLDPRADDTPAVIRQKVGQIPPDPPESYFESAKFARFMKGRLLFYAREVPCFDSAWLIRNELGRIVRNFYERPLITYAALRWREALSPEQALDRLSAGPLDRRDCDGMKRFAEVAGLPLLPGAERERAREVAAVYDPVLRALETLGAEVLRLCGEPRDVPAAGAQR